MDTLYNTLVETTRQNFQKKVEKETSQKIAHQMKIKQAMADIFTKIISNDIENQMKTMAESGHNKCEIFSFEKGEMFNDFPLVFLTRGPQNYNGFGLKYFDDLNIIPFIKQLQQYYSPFSVYFTSNYKSGKTSIYITW